MFTKFDIWYMRPDFFINGTMGVDWLRERRLMPEPTNLSETHIHLMARELPGGSAQLEHIFEMQQGEVWSPNGEARELIRSKGLEHTSMSVGDIVVVDGKTYMVDRFGFEELE